MLVGYMNYAVNFLSHPIHSLSMGNGQNYLVHNSGTRPNDAIKRVLLEFILGEDQDCSKQHQDKRNKQLH